jgi:outer membrane receptor for ferric coprogen and ferric-rhodotorulic acid
MTRQRIDDQSLNSLTDVLEQTPGINVQHIDSERFSVYSRGYGIDNYQYDGIPTNMIPSTGATQQSLSDMAIFDRIEVVRGATGLLTGAGDPSGTINLVRKRPTAEFQGYVSAGMGSWDRYRTEMDVSGPLTDNGRLRGRLVGAYETAHSSIDWYEQNKQVFYGVLEADVTDSTTVSVGVDYQKNRPVGVSYGGLPLWYSNGSQTDFSRSTNAAARWSSRQQDTVNSFYNLEQKLANDWSLKVAANQMYSKRQNNLASLSGGFADEQTGDGYYLYGGKGNAWQKQGGLDVMLQGPFELLGRQHELVLGFNYMKFEDRNADLNVDTSGHGENIYSWDNYTAHSQFASGSEVYARYNTVIHQNGVYLATRLKPTDDLSVILGTRVSNYKYDYQDDYIDNPSWNTTTRYSQTGVVTPYAGVVYDLTDNHSVYASYTSIYKPQSYRDQSGKALDPREGNVYEFGLKSEYLGGRLNTAVALFESRQDNLAEADGLIGSTTQTAYRAVKGARTRGIDMEISGEVLPDWNVSASYSHSLTKDADNERINTVIPANMFKFWNTYRLPGELDRFTVGGGFNWQSGIHLTATPWQLGKTVKATQDDYAVFNLMGKYQVTEHLSTILNVDNLFDKQYISSMDNNFYGGYYGDPRNLMVTAKYQF